MIGEGFLVYPVFEKIMTQIKQVTKALTLNTDIGLDIG